MTPGEALDAFLEDPANGIDLEGTGLTPDVIERAALVVDAQARASERAKIAWWLRAGIEGPALVNTDPTVIDAMADLADVLEHHPERWVQAPDGTT